MQSTVVRVESRISVVEGREECWGGWGLFRISQKNRILGWDVVAWAKNNATIRLLKKQSKRKKKVKP